MKAKKTRARKAVARRASNKTKPQAGNRASVKTPVEVRAGRDAPFALWRRVILERKASKDGPFPLLSDGLGYENVAFRILYQGSRGPTSLTTVVIRTREELRTRAAELLAAQVDFSSIDFTKEELIVVGLGQRPTNAHIVSIDSVLHFTDQLSQSSISTLVHYSEQIAAGGADVLTYPSVCIALRNLSGDTEFESGS
jgi:hypothetical protein